MSYPTVAGTADFGTPYREAQSCLGPTFANSTYKFFLTGTSTPANVYQNGALTTPFSPTGVVTSDAYGRFPPIYLDTSVAYKVQFYDNTSTLRWTRDPYTTLLSTVGTSSLSSYGVNIATTGEVTIPAPAAGGTGISLTLKAGTLGVTPLKITGTLPGNSALIVNNSATTGAQTATFQANNKPGPPPLSYNVTATAAPSGSTYTGGNLTTNFTGVTAGNYTLQLSTGQDIFGVTFTNGSTTFITPSTVISGTPSAALIVSVPVTPSWWLPITCDGVQYYTPIWHGSSQSQFLPSAPASPSAQGETIVGSSFTLSGAGVTTVVGGTATPGNWLVPTSVGAGANYWINITKTGGLSGLAFSAAQGSWTNITGAGLTISSNAQATITGTYQLSSSVTGTPVAAAGTISLSNNNGVQQPTYNSSANLVLGGDGTATLNGVSASNWFTPTTANTGASYWIKITQTGGTSGYSFSAGAGAYTNITNGGLTIGLSGSGSTSIPNVTGTYVIASDSGGVNQLGTGNITLSGSVIHVYTTGTNATETFPSGTSNVQIEAWGGPGGGGSGNSGASNGGGGGGGPGYSRSSYAASGGGGLTLKYTAGTAGVGGVSGNGSTGTASTVSSGTFAITAMTANGGAFGNTGTGGGPGVGGAGGTASGGNQANTAGGAGANGTSTTGGAGGTPPAGVNTSGNTGGAGGVPATPPTGNGHAGTGPGVVAFYYT